MSDTPQDDINDVFRLSCGHFMDLSHRSYKGGDWYNAAGFGQAAGAFAVAAALTDMLTWMKAADDKATASVEEAKVSARAAAEMARMAMLGLGGEHGNG